MNACDYVKAQVNLGVTSSAFEDGGTIPKKYTGRGEDNSPPIKLETIDKKAETIAIIMDDLDNPLGMFNHWVIWNIPASFSDIPEGISKEKIVKSLGNAVQGQSYYGNKHYYRGPKPPFGTHKYVFKVYVLDSTLNLSENSDKVALQKTMEGHILQYGTLTGYF
ncbi:YbhB/YbcL family Raf kinase inhibitor-like protein [Clostridium sp. P21]|uniref:YbhB/YbcL family Raf kinase inhibitor-like protein n=2 Tax=Clostridium muellerianum TaxID=2716538 RepID=A0A7Y0EIX3_9CLOT|nr:YbhB/YbcL family Raf kinase inhibitor-like protein [Clostridium muellerianum]